MSAPYSRRATLIALIERLKRCLPTSGPPASRTAGDSTKDLATLTPFARAAEHWNAHRTPSCDTFAQVIEQHAQHGGFVVMDPKLFIAARPVCHWWPNEWLADIQMTTRYPDCWYVYLAAGSLTEFSRIIPYELPHIAFHRNRSTRKVVVASRYLLSKLGSSQSK